MSMSEYEILCKKIKDSKKIPIEEMNEDEIDNIDSIKINKENAKQVRIANFVKEAKNPYCFYVDDMIVKFEFSNSNKEIGQCLNNLVMNKKRW